MGMITAPYNNAMRLGCGFNSFTQSLCVNDAVLKDNRKPATEETLRVVDGETSQIVTYTATFVEHASEVLNAMNIKGSVTIKMNGLGEGAVSGSYVNTDQMKDSDINYLIQVKVVNQKLVSDDLARFNAIANLPASSFTETYGDSFISGFVEGGEFYALLSIKLLDSYKDVEIGGKLSVGMDKGVIKGQVTAEGGYTDKEALKNSTTTISVSWSGGGQIRPKEDLGKDWTLESMKRAANGFPEKVALHPQRTHAILTKYNALRSYQELTNKGTPLDYENAGVYTNALLDAYMEYKDLWKTISSLSNDVSSGRGLVSTADKDGEYYTYAQEAQADYIRKLKAYYYPDMSIAGLEKASQPLPPKSISNGTANGAPNGTVATTASPGQSDDSERQLALVNHDIVVAKKKLAVLAKGEVFEPPLKPNNLRAYAPTLLGLDQARRDCRWEMIKIVKEVDAVTNEPGIATDTTRVWQYLNPTVFKQLLPTLANPPPPYSQAHMDTKLAIIEQLTNDLTTQQAHEAKAVADAIANKVKEIDGLNTQIGQITDKAQKDQAKAVADVMVQVNQLNGQIKDLDTRARAGDTAIADRKTLQTAYDDMNTKFNSFQQSNAQYTQSLVKAVERVESDLNPAGGLRPDAVAPFYGEIGNDQTSITDCRNLAVQYMASFDKPLSYIPRVITGINMIDVPVNTLLEGPSFSAYGHNTTKEGFTMMRGIGDAPAFSINASWMTIPENGLHIETGVADTAGIVRTVEDKKPFSQQIKFRTQFSKPPKMHVWIQAVDWQTPGKFRRIEAHADPVTITNAGAVINIQTWLDTVIRTARVGWIAYDSDQQGKRIKSDEISVLDASRAKLPIRSDFVFKSVQFGGEKFSRTPGIFTAFSRLDVDPSFGHRTLTRVKDVTQDSFSHSHQTWHDSVIIEIRSVWIAMN